MSVTHGVVYAIRNSLTGRVYVGVTERFSSRWPKHRTELNNGRHHNAQLQTDWAKQGAESFRFDVLERVGSRRDLYARERRWIACLSTQCGTYNVPPSERRRLSKQAASGSTPTL